MNTLSSIVNLSSITCLKELTEKQIKALKTLGIMRLSDLLNYDPIKNAKMILMLARDEITIDLHKANIIDVFNADIPINQLPTMPVKTLKGIGDTYSKIFNDEFGIFTIEQLAAFKPFEDAEKIVLKYSNEFSEPASAPEALIPKIVGSVASQYSYTNFIKEKRLRFSDLELVFDDQRLYVDPRLLALFIATNSGNSKKIAGAIKGGKISNSVQIPEVQVGYISKLTQKWINYGTHLGEVIHSLPLAPGESRNIAVIDWKRKQRSAKKEDTTVSEQLTNSLFHKRALDEVTRSTAAEHQQGGTDISAATIATAGAGVLGAAVAGGVAGSLPGAAIGAIVGAVAGAPILDGGGATIAGGALAGAVIGFGAGAAIAGGAALVGAANAQMGTIQSDSSGDRGINAKLSQNIEESIKQKSSSIRSLWSSVIVTDEQAESENLTTRNITNYNHSHALTIQYFEVLQHYKSELCLTQAEPFLMLPFSPLEFDFDLIVDFWSILKFGVHDVNLFKDFDKLVNGIDDEVAGTGKIIIEAVMVYVTRPSNPNSGFLGFPLIPPARVNLIGAGNIAAKEVVQGLAQFRNFQEETEAKNFTGIQVENLLPSERVYINIFARLKDENNQLIQKRINNTEFFANNTGAANYNFSLVESNLSDPENRQRSTEAIEKYFNSHRYRFTRMLLLAIEKEQLIDVVESLILRMPNPALNKLMQTAYGDNFGTSKTDSGTNTNSVNSSFSKSFSESVRKSIMFLLSDIINKNELLQKPRSVVLDAIHILIIQIDEFIFDNTEKQPKSESERKKIVDGILKIIETWFTKFKEFAKEKKQFKEKLKVTMAKLFSSLEKFDSYDSFIHLSEFIDTTPFAITGNTLMFKMKKITDNEVLANPLIKNNVRIKDLKDYPEDIANYRNSILKNKSQHTLSSDIYLPTSGVFAEAILGVSNASEKIDLTRYINWQDMPIPNLAPAINALNAGQHNVTQQDLSSTVPASVLNIMNPPALPDPTGMSGILNAIQNGNIFRDMSKSDQLVTVMGNLSNLAQSMAQQAGSLAGQAQSDALKAATEIGKQVAQLASQAASQPSNSPKSFTEKGGAANSLEKFISNSGNGSGIQVPDEIKSILGVGGSSSKGSNSEAITLPFLNEKRNVSDLIRDFSNSDLGELKLNNDGGNIEFKKNPTANSTDGVPEFKIDPTISERSQIKDIINKAAASPLGGLSENDKKEIAQLFKSVYTRTIKPELEANQGIYETTKCSVRKMLDWAAEIQLLGVDDELASETKEAMDIAEQKMQLALTKSVENAKANNDIKQIRQAIDIISDAQLLGFDAANFDLDKVIASLNLSVIITSTFDKTITNGQGKSLNVNVQLKIDSNNGTPFFGAPIGLNVIGCSVEPSLTGAIDQFGNFNCTVNCIDRANLSISGLISESVMQIETEFVVEV